MTDAGFFRGTSADQDNRFANKQKKLLKELNFSPILNTKLNMSKIDIDALRPWIDSKIKEILEKDDELLSDAIYEHLAEKEPDGKNFLVLITGFVDENKASKFMEELWTKLVDLQNNSNGKTPTTEEVTQAGNKLENDEKSDYDNPPADKNDNNSSRPHKRREHSPQQDDTRPERGSRSRSNSGTPPSRSVSKSPGGNHRLDERSRGRPRRRAHEDDASSHNGSEPRRGKGSRSPSSTSRSPTGHNRDLDNGSPRGPDESARHQSRSRSRSKSPSRRRLNSRSRSTSRSRSRSPWNRSRSPHSRPYRGRRGSPFRRSPDRRSPFRRRMRSRSRSRSYSPRSRSPRGRRGFSGPRGSYRGTYGGFPDRRRGGFGGGMRRRSPLGNNRRFSPRSPPRYRRSPSFSPRRRRRSPSPYQRRISRSRSPPPHMVGRNASPYRGHHPAEMLAPRHPYHDVPRPMLPNQRPRMNLDHRNLNDGPMLPRHSPPGPSIGKISDLPSTSQAPLHTEPSSQETHSPPSSARKKHKKDKKHRKHKKSKKHRSVTPDRKKKKHKKSKKHKDH